MIKKVSKGVYPCFESKIKCLESLVNFKKGQFYLIEGFGKMRDEKGVLFQVWYIQDMSNPNIKFPVKKETIEMMFDSGKIIHVYN